MAMVWSTSSKIPVALAIQITRNWKKARVFADNVEKDYADDPFVMSALASRYLELKRYDDAERCAKQKIRVGPDYDAYWTLADVYWRKADKPRWKSTLEDALVLPSMGLESARVRDRIARYHMQRKEWKEAVVFADVAAESYSAWSMQTAARCHEMLGDLDKAEELLKAVSQRYAGSSSLDWMTWCHRTGHGNIDAATELAKRYFESFGKAVYPSQLDQLGNYHLMKNEPELALAAFKQAYQQAHSSGYGMEAAIVADRLGNTAQRDALLAEIVNAGKALDPHSFDGVYVRLARLMQKALPPGTVHNFDFTELEGIFKDASAETSEFDMHIAFFLAIFFKNRGDADRSREYLIRCARLALVADEEIITCAMACNMLRELKIPIPEPIDPHDAKEKENKK